MTDVTFLSQPLFFRIATLFLLRKEGEKSCVEKVRFISTTFVLRGKVQCTPKKERIKKKISSTSPLYVKSALKKSPQTKLYNTHNTLFFIACASAEVQSGPLSKTKCPPKPQKHTPSRAPAVQTF